MGMPPMKIETRMFDQWFRSWNQDISRRLPFFGRGVKIGCKNLDICQLNIGEFNQTASGSPLNELLVTKPQSVVGEFYSNLSYLIIIWYSMINKWIRKWSITYITLYIYIYTYYMNLYDTILIIYIYIAMIQLYMIHLVFCWWIVSTF